MKKKTYQRPQTAAVRLYGPVMMVEGSNRVNDYRRGSDIFVGDVDDD